MKKIVLVYDNTINVSDKIKTIIGNKSFGDIVIKRKSLYEKLKENVEKIKVKENIELIRIDKNIDFDIIKKYPSDTIFFHLFSNMAIIDDEKFKIILEKLTFIKENMTVESEKIAGIILKDRDNYISFLEEYLQLDEFIYKTENKVKLDIFIDLTEYSNLIMYISNGFDARYFNNLEGNKYTVTKKSTDKNKMKMEYTYYWLLPENMKSWMVMPYDYKEESTYAQYTMERMPMTDVAIRWTHGAIDVEEFNTLMDKVFYFFSCRKQKEISKEEYKECSDKLYLEKVRKRIKMLKEKQEFLQISKLIESGTKYNSIDEIEEEYEELYKIVNKKNSKNIPSRSVIGHGDVFFANMLYSKETNLLRLIDPKGALEEKDLWTDSYYDIAKLSHSVCGNYDFFNSGAYDIQLNSEMQFELNLHFDNSKYKEIFKKYLEKSEYNYIMVRLYEASLFLSMLPLHIDNPNKVFGFLLNAINIMKEIKENV